ncbi:YafY family transcriptional regulator [Oscillospiraceae bacterium CM]|nr:YafY family transcriptional regulator [Oscillospiraceae bacterium CM]
MMRMSRLFEITYLLLERQNVTARALAERFEVSVRTIYRDVEELSAAGIPVYMQKGRNGGISLMPDFILDKTVLTAQEKEQVLSALAALSAANRHEGVVIEKLSALFGSRAANWIEVDFSGWGWGQIAKDDFALIKSAILERRVLSFTYHGGQAYASRRVAEPLKLVFRGQAWYLFAWCRKRRAPRFFKLSRIEELTVSDETFDREVPERALPETMLAQNVKILVRLRADDAVSFRIFDEFPHGAIKPDGENGLIVESLMPDGDWLVSYLLSYGSCIDVLEPPVLRAKIKAELEFMYRRYEENMT